MRSASVVVFFVIVLYSDVVLAFSGPEHHDLSNLALKTALASGKGSKEIRGIAESLLTSSDKEGTFGDLVKAVDSFSHPYERLTAKDAWTAISKRSSKLIFHLLALHRNSAHFQYGAVSEYAKIHGSAIEAACASPDNAWLALYTEAVALHFLQDSLASGHLVTPRSGMTDAVAGSLHDRINRVGAQVEIAPNDPEKWVEWLATLKKAQVGAPLSTVVKPAVTVSELEIDAMIAEVRGGARVRFFGDDYLNTSEASIQKLAILLLSIQSIADVLDASAGTEKEGIQVCFAPRNVERDEGTAAKMRSFRGSSASWDEGEGVSSFRDETDKPFNSHECDGLPGLVRYSVEWTKGFDSEDYAFHGIQATAVAGVGGALHRRRTMVEIASLFSAGDPRHTVRMRDGDTVKKEWWENDLGSASLGVSGSFVEGPHYQAGGLMGEGIMNFQVLPRGLAAGLRWGYRHYRGLHQTSNVFDYGVKLVAGIEVLNLTLVVDRGLDVDRREQLHKETFVMGGIEISLSWGWVNHVLGRGPSSQRASDPSTH